MFGAHIFAEKLVLRFCLCVAETRNSGLCCNSTCPEARVHHQARDTSGDTSGSKSRVPVEEGLDGHVLPGFHFELLHGKGGGRDANNGRQKVVLLHGWLQVGVFLTH